jgi:tetratricopeptide (TPR) repeat protein
MDTTHDKGGATTPRDPWTPGERMRLLVGPFHDPEHWAYMQGAFDDHDALTFGTGKGVNLSTRPIERLDDLLARLPEGWGPDLLLLWRPEYGAVPWGLEEAPFPVVMLTSDWYLEFHDCVETARFVNAVVTGSRGLRVFAAAGFTHTIRLPMLGYEPGVDGAFPSQTRDIDVLYAGSTNWSAHPRRERVLARLLDLPAAVEVAYRTRITRAEYSTLLSRARIVVNPTVVGEINMRVYETGAAGACLFVEEDNLDVPALLPDGVGAVYYREDNLLERVLYYLEHEEERARIAAFGQRTLRGTTYRANMGAIVRALQELGRVRLSSMGREINRAGTRDRIRHFVAPNLRYSAGDNTVLREMLRPLEDAATPRDRLLISVVDYTLAVDRWREQQSRPVQSAQLEHALRGIMRAAREAPCDVSIAYALAAYSGHHARPEAALRLIDHLIALLEGGAPVPYGGTAFYAMEPNEDLRRRFERVAWEAVERGLAPGAALHPLLLDRAYRWRGETLIKLGRNEAAADALARALAAYPAASLAAPLLARLLATLHRWVDAVAVLRRHLEVRPLDSDARLMLVEALLAQEDDATAAEQLARLARIHGTFGDEPGAARVRDVHRRLQARQPQRSAAMDR